MRIVGGQLKGQKLSGPASAKTRPTSDRVREAVFSILGPIDGLVVLDLFAGTGALGLEALSRGVASVDFVENDRRAAAVIAKNLELLEGQSGIGRAELYREDASGFLERAARSGSSYGLVYLDPPYSGSSHLGSQLAKPLLEVLAQNGLVVAESDRRNPIDLTVPAADAGSPGLQVEFERGYGDTLIRLFGA